MSGKAHKAEANEESIKSNLSVELNKMTRVFSKNSKEIDKFLVIGDIARLAIQRDYYYLISKRSRPRMGGAERKSVHEDQFLSHLCYYGLAGHKTGAPEYDQMFQEVIEYLKTSRAVQRGVWKKRAPLLFLGKDSRENLSKLAKVIKKYNKTHFEEEVSL